MPVSRLLVRPDAEPSRALAQADRIGLSVVAPEQPSPPLASVTEIGLGAIDAASRGAAPLAGPTATPPASVVAPIATVIGPLGPVRAARWNAQLPAVAAGTSAVGEPSPNADATSS
jgi:hypothetical protein